MSRNWMGLLVALGVAAICATAGRASEQSSGKASSDPSGQRAASLVGTWRLTSLDRGAAKAANQPIGFMMYDAAGYMAVAIMDSGRQKYAAAEPTPGEARAAFESFTSYFGTYVVNQSAGTLAFHVDGSLDPNLTDTDRKISFQLSGDRLTMGLPLTLNHAPHNTVWERLPNLTALTPTHGRVIGFWKLVPNEGQENAANQEGRRGFIIYTASGHNAVHIMPGGRKKYAGTAPTPEEAKTLVRGYTSYFGPFDVNENDGYLVHRRIGHTIPASIGSNAQRFYQFSGKRLILRLVSTTFTVPTTLEAAKTEGREASMITWERISEMPRAGGGR